MAVTIRGAPEVGWYFPEVTGKGIPVYWSGISRYRTVRGRQLIEGQTWKIFKQAWGPQLQEEWGSSSKILSVPKGRIYTSTPPLWWRDQDIGEVIRQVAQRMSTAP